MANAKRKPSARPRSAKPAKARKPSKNTSLLPTSTPELLGMVSMAAGLLVLASLASYHTEDLTTSAGDAHAIQNWIGPAGAYIAEALFAVLGLAAFAVGIGITRTAWSLLLRRSHKIGLRTWVGLGTGLVALTGLAHLWVPPEPFAFAPGGMLGLVVAIGISKLFSLAGATIILSTLALLALSEMVGIGPAGLVRVTVRTFAFDRLRNGLRRQWDALKVRWSLEAEERKALRAERRRWKQAEKAARSEEKAEARSQVKAEKQRKKDGTRPPDNVVEFPSVEPAKAQTEAPGEGFEDSFFQLDNEPDTNTADEPAWAAGLAQTTPQAEEKGAAPVAKEKAVESVAEDAKPTTAPRIVAQVQAELPDTKERTQADEAARAREVLKRKMERKKKNALKRGIWQLPSLDLLDYKAPESNDLDTEWLQETARKITEKLAEFKITGKVIEIRPGPTVTLYEFEPGPGIKVSKIARYSDDLQMALGARSTRIIAPLPLKSTVGIEIPNRTRQTVYLKELLADPAWSNSKAALPMALGRDGEGRSFYMDLAKTPHLLVAGGTGSGKSVGVNTMILSLLYRFAPADLRLILIDPKMLEFAPFKDIPHLLVPPITDSSLATNALAWSCKEMDRRYALLAEAGVKNIAEYNERLEGHLEQRVAERKALVDAMRAEAESVHAEMLEEKGPSLKMVADDAGEPGEDGEMAVVERAEESVEITEDSAPPTPASLPDNHDLSAENDPEIMPYIVIVVDEFADLMMTAGKDIETHVGRLAQKARAAGMHVILATQRPSVDVVTGVIKVNFPSRIAFRVSAVQDSRTIIERTGAERLLGNGDMLVIPPNASDPSRVQGAFVSTDELTRILEDVRSKGAPDYDDSILASAEPEGGAAGPSDEPYDSLWLDCLRIAASEGHISTSWLQRRLSIGYTRAGRIIDRMEREGLVGPGRGAKPREVFVTLEQLENPDQPMGQSSGE
jgi:DNA segregation ATPase FtsK/SpoIIIE, S-DNA-T family